MYSALGSVRRLCSEYRAKSGRAFWFLELLPGPLFLYCFSPASFNAFYKMFVGTYFHYCGTCRMEMAPPVGMSHPARSHRVDEHLRVRGVDGLRIADASVFPWIPSAPIAATSMAVGVNASRLILGHQ